MSLRNVYWTGRKKPKHHDVEWRLLTLFLTLIIATGSKVERVTILEAHRRGPVYVGRSSAATASPRRATATRTLRSPTRGASTASSVAAPTSCGVVGIVPRQGPRVPAVPARRGHLGLLI